MGERKRQNATGMAPAQYGSWADGCSLTTPSVYSTRTTEGGKELREVPRDGGSDRRTWEYDSSMRKERRGEEVRWRKKKEKVVSKCVGVAHGRVRGPLLRQPMQCEGVSCVCVCVPEGGREAWGVRHQRRPSAIPVRPKGASASCTSSRFAARDRPSPLCWF